MHRFREHGVDRLGWAERGALDQLWIATVIQLIETRRQALEELCRKYRVARLELFGSAAKGRFDPMNSDLDFLVDFFPESPMGPFHQYFDFLADLESLFGCRIDLVEATAMKNPYFIRVVSASRIPLYAA